MESVKELEEKLRLAKAEVVYNKALDLLKLHIGIKGKYYSTHVLSGDVLRSSKGHINLRALKVLDVYVGYYGGRKINSIQEVQLYEEPKVFCTVEVVKVHISKDGKNEFSISEENIRCPISGVIKEVKEEDYTKLKNFLISQFHTIISKGAISELDSKPFLNYVGGYDKSEVLKKYGYSFIELTSEEYVAISNWHPYVYGTKLLVSLESKNILEDIIRDYVKKDANDIDHYFAGERIRRNGYYGRQLDILNKIYNKL